MKQFQKTIARSRLSLPVTSVYAILVWIVCGVLTEQWWLQFGCFALTTYLMMQLNNLNALLRVYSRMVSCSFLALSCCACFLFPSVRGALTGVCIAAAWLTLSQTYQDKQSVGITYYGFLLVGLASTAYVQVLFLVPLLWLLMATQLLALSWRTWKASLLGLLTPYWFWLGWLLFRSDFSPFVNHFLQLSVFRFPIDYSVLNQAQWAVYAFTALLTFIHVIHYMRDWHNDKIRIRLLYGFFLWMDLAALAGIAIQPQFYDMLMHIAIVCTAPLIGHYLALSSSKLSNIVSCIIFAVTLAITVYSLWTF